MAKDNDKEVETVDEADSTQTGAQAPASEPESTSEDASNVDAPATPEAAPTYDIVVNGRKLKTSLKLSSNELPQFKIGDTVKVHYKIREGDKERVQVYEGNVIAMQGEGLNKTFIVRRISHEIGVERIFPYHSPFIDKLEVTRRGRVRRAKLFYLRGKSGKDGRIKESFDFQKDAADKPEKKKRRKARTKKPKAEEAASA